MAGSLAGIKVAVTGGTGFLGFHIVKALTEEGAVVSVLARPQSDRSRIESFGPKWVEGDMSNPDAIAKLARGAEVFIHAAGLTSAASPKQYYEVNVEGTRRAVAAAVKESVSAFILISSQAAMGPTPLAAGPRQENDPPNPRSIYGKSKLAAEKALEQEGSGLKERIILRPGAIYGPYDKDFFMYFRLIALRLRLLLGQRRRIFQPVWAGDVALACVAALRQRAGGLRSYFIVGRETVTWEDFSLAVAKVAGRKAACVRLPELLFQPRLLELMPSLRPVADRLADLLEERWEADPSRAQEELGFSAATQLEDGLKQTWEWYKQQGWI